MSRVSTPPRFSIDTLDMRFEPFSTCIREIDTNARVQGNPVERRVGYIYWGERVLADVTVGNNTLLCERRVDRKRWGRVLDALPLTEQIELLTYIALDAN